MADGEFDVSAAFRLAEGDHVLIALRDTLSATEAQEMHDALGDLFPGIGFTFLTDVTSVAVLRKPGADQ